MLKFKSRKGFVPALLTLGLVLVGSLVTIGISYLTSTNKIASNPRAAGCTAADIPESACACCFKKAGQSPVVYASSQSRINNCMGTPCTTANYTSESGIAYGAESWGYCDDGGGDYGSCSGNVGGGGVNPPTPKPCNGSGGGCEFNCESVGEECSCEVGGTWYNGTCTTKGKPGTCAYCGGGGISAADCTGKNYNCSSLVTGTDYSISYDINDVYYQDKNCGTKIPKNGTLGEAISFCEGTVKGKCEQISCQTATGGDPKALSSNIRIKTVQGVKTYHNLGDTACGTVLELTSLCYEQAKATCDSVSCNIATKNNNVDFDGNEVYQWSDKPGTYYKANDCEEKVSSGLKTECPVPDPLENVVKSDSRTFFCGTSIGLIAKEKYKNSVGKIVGNLSSFVERCEASGKAKGIDVQVVIGDGDIEGPVVNDYMNCCKK